MVCWSFIIKVGFFFGNWQNMHELVLQQLYQIHVFVLLHWVSAGCELKASSVNIGDVLLNGYHVPFTCC